MAEVLTPERPMPRWLSPGTHNRPATFYPVSGFPWSGFPIRSPPTAHRFPLLGCLASAMPPNTTNRGLVRLVLKVVGS